MHITTEYNQMIGQVLWDMTAGADNYTVEGVTDEGLMVSCITDDNFCAVYDMKCGEMYRVTVTANNDVCQGLSTSTEAVTITTGEKQHWWSFFFFILSPVERSKKTKL